ncbi:MAG: hypothetical protein L0323_18600, partial [Planctomycetes bacterium]|nr:hypothetical protein [Planctomycetota bacterium]
MNSRPLPEILFPGDWTVRHVPRGGHTGRSARVLAAPFDATPLARAVRLHELAHVKFSPSRPNAARFGVAADTLLFVEDARVNECARRAGLGAVIWELEDRAIESPDPRRRFRKAVLFLLACHGTRAYERVAADYEASGDAGALARNLAERARKAFTEPKARPKFRATVEVARMLDDLLGDPDGPPEFPDGATGPREPAGAPGRPRVPDGPPRWGELRRIEEPARTLPVPGASCRGMRRAAEEGLDLRFPHRLLVDRRVFARRVRLRGGTVLVDASASMKLKPNDLLAIVAAAPGAEVACYEGAAEGWGVVRILARAGRRVADSFVVPPLGKGANVIDGPA